MGLAKIVGTVQDVAKSFNGRTGAVVPQDGDYDTSMISTKGLDFAEVTSGGTTKTATATGALNYLHDLIWDVDSSISDVNSSISSVKALANTANTNAASHKITNSGTTVTLTGTELTPSSVALKSPIVNLIYPVGSIYMSVNSTSPATLFGGTWTQLQDRFLIGAGSSYAVNATGGSTTHTLTTAEMPSHTHTFTGSAVTSGTQSANHTHTFSATSGSSGAHTHTGFLPGVHPRQKTDDGAWGMISSLKSTWQAITSAALTASGISTATNVYGTAYITIPSAGAHTHSVSGTTGANSANHTHSVTANGTNSNTGFGNAHSIMNPYLAVYMWKRTA